MCGLAGFIGPGAPGEVATSVISAMTDSLEHRGPDARGIWFDQSGSVALGHRRLRILDLSDSSAQPYFSPNRSQVLVFNGEIYNHRAIARQLKSLGREIRTRGDTEVMMQAFLQWGCEEALKRMSGMFAFAFVDLAAGKIFLGRDRMGEKPLFYGWSGGALLFASELRALAAYPGFDRRPRRSVLGNFLRYGCIPAPDTIYENVFKLAPGHVLCASLADAAGTFQVRPYWQMAEVVGNGIERSRLARTDQQSLAEFEGILDTVVREQAAVDVPIGAFLSGGLDSSLIAAVAQRQANASSGGRLKTFTIGFQQRSFDEAPFAAAIAKHIGTDHHELYVSPAEALRVAERLPSIYDEPFADSSQIPTFLVSEWARKKVTVCLAGDGGDEVFAGYNRHFIGTTFWAKVKYLPFPTRQLLARSWRNCPMRVKVPLARLVGLGLGGRFGAAAIVEKIDKLMLCLRAGDYHEMYLDLLALDSDPQRYLLDRCAPVPALLATPAVEENPLFAMQYLDSLFYLPDDILTKTDRASMAVSLEVRAPFLDHRLVEFAWGLPPEQRVRNGKGKWLVREAAGKLIPPALLNRPKVGFAIPINDWLRGPLRPWAEALLDPAVLTNDGYFHVENVRACWDRYLKGQEASQYLIWNLLMFQSWLREQDLARASVGVPTLAMAPESPILRAGSSARYSESRT